MDSRFGDFSECKVSFGLKDIEEEAYAVYNACLFMFEEIQMSERSYAFFSYLDTLVCGVEELLKREKRVFWATFEKHSPALEERLRYYKAWSRKTLVDFCNAHGGCDQFVEQELFKTFDSRWDGVSQRLRG